MKNKTNWMIVYSILAMAAIILGIIAFIQGDFNAFCMEICVACLNINILTLVMRIPKEASDDARKGN